MEFNVMIRGYNLYGGHKILSHIGDFFLIGAPDFGPGIRELVVTLHLPHSGRAKRSLEGMLEDYLRSRSSLPKIVFRRGKALVEIDIASEVLDTRSWKKSSSESLALFEKGVEEVSTALALLKKSVRKSDRFSLDTFLRHCESALQRMPASEQALEDLIDDIQIENRERNDAMSPWEKLAIDWDEFHPEARQILDDPFFWDGTNDFSPNGNDTGADVLMAYLDWRQQHRFERPLQFLEHLAASWGFSGLHDMDADTSSQAYIGLAFSEIKLRAVCDKDVRDAALDSIQLMRQNAAMDSEWLHREEYLASLSMIEKKLMSISCQGQVD